MKLKPTLMVADFETTVYEGQKSTEVWAAACCQLFTEDVKIFNDIGTFMKHILGLKKGITIWFHNLRFDGSFILNWMFRNGWEWVKELPRKSKQFTTLISKENRWYSITLKTPYNTIEIRDSAKLMPMTLEEIGKAFNTKHQKLTMVYEGKRYAGCPIEPDEMRYIRNDCLVLKEALEFMLKEGHDKLTIGSCCLKEYKNGYAKEEWDAIYPRLDEIKIDKNIYGSETVDGYVRKSYKGAFCYVKPEYKDKFIGCGFTFDVNSLYPYVMGSSSHNYYPIGKPIFWSGNFIPEDANNKCYFLRIRCRFKLKEGMLPTIQIKGNPYYRGNEWLTTSDIKYRGKYYSEFINKKGEKVSSQVVLTLTWLDYKLFCDHYEVYDLEILDGCYFNTAIGLFDAYLDKYRKQKETSTGGKRTEAKLFSNNMYGKLATSTDADYRKPELDIDGCLSLILEDDEPKEAFYIAQGSMVTSYARYYTITHAQDNYSIFAYSDTDSLHLIDDKEIKPVNIEEHPTKYGAWKKECEWSSAKFIRQKTYAEFVRKKDGEKVYPHWEITAAGMPKRSKDIFIATHPITDFKTGLKVGGKLRPKQYPGGVVLEETFFTLRA